MHTMKLAALALAGILGAVSLSACDLDVGDLNNPGLDQLEEAPTAVTINAAATGLQIGGRRNHANANGYVSQLAILGREAYNFDGADPRYIGELLSSTLAKGSPFGGNFWTFPYANIRLANVTLTAIDKVSDTELTPGKKSGLRGYIYTMKALDLLEIINTHDTNGAVIKTDQAFGQPLGPIVSKAETFTEIARLLDEGAALLAAEGATFSFEFGSGYDGFNTPAAFRKFNRAIRARVAAYVKDYATVNTALAESFIQDDAANPIDLKTGVYYTYSTKTGDVTNGLLNPNIFGHPALKTDVQSNGATVDLRYTSKIEEVDEDDGGSGGNGLESNLTFTLYTTSDAPVPLIRNEELILLKAEALFFTNQVAAAVTELNLVREQSGGLAPLTGTPDEATFVSELLYERRYSLLFEGGHRWIDLRRFSRTSELSIDQPKDVRNVRYPIPQSECNARPNEPACELGSTDG